MKLNAHLILTLITSISVSLRAADIREGLVSYWPLDSIAADFSSTPDLASANHFSLANIFDPSVLVDGQRGKALAFDGSGTYAYFTAPADADVGLPISRARNYSVLLWVKGKGTGQNDRRFFSESSSTVNDPLVNLGTHNAGADDTIDIFIRNSGTKVNHAHSPTAGLDDTWHHIAWTYDNAQGRLYIDGQLDYTASFTPGPTPYDTTSIGAIVRATPGSYFTGIVDEVALWERVLTPEEIRNVMTNGIQTPVPAFPASFVAQPQGSTNLIVSDSYVLSATVIGTRPLTFEWRKNSDVIAGAAGPTLSLNNVTLADSGDYTLTVRNSSGVVVSQAAKLVVNPPAPPNLTNEMVAYWPLDEVQGIKTPDVLRGYDMELINLTAADLNDGKFGKAFRFENARQTMMERLNGTGDDLPIYKHLNFSVSLWVKGPPNQQDLRIFSEASTSVNQPLFNIGTHTSAANGAVDMYIRNDSGAIANGAHQFSTAEPFDDAWHHIVYVQREANGMREGALYIDSVKDALELVPVRPLTLNSTSIGGIRRATRSFFFNGLIDDVAVWKRAISAEEVTKLFTEGTPRPTAIAQPLAIRKFQSSLPAVATGDNVTLHWDVSKDATAIEINEGVGNVMPNTTVGAGSITVPISASKQFILTVRRGTETVTATNNVVAVTGIAPNWALLDNFDTYANGPFPSTYWGDLGGNSIVTTINTNRMLDMRGTGRLAVLPLGELTAREGQERTLFGRIYVQGDPVTAVQSYFGLSDRGFRSVGDVTDAGGAGPSAQPGNSLGELMIGARNGVGGVLDFAPPALETGQLYNLWIDVKNDPIATGDIFSIWLQKVGDTARTKVFSDYISNRDPAGNPGAAGGGATLPDLDKVFLGNNTANAVFFDDIYISKSGYNSTIPRAAGFTGVPPTNSAPAGLIAYEGFDYPAATDLTGQNGGTGWLTPWGANNSGVTNPQGTVPGDTARSGSLQYTDAKGNKLVTSGGHGFYTGESGTAQPFRDFPRRGESGTTTWISFIGVRGGPTADNVNIYPRGSSVAFFDANSERFGIGNASGSPTNAWSILNLGGSLANLRQTARSFQEQSFVVVRIDHKDGNDQTYLFLDPPLDAEPALNAAAAQTIGEFDHPLNRVRPFAGNPDAANNRPYAELAVDEIRIGGTYASVTPFTSGTPGGNLAISRVGNEVTITWASGTLESTTDLIAGQWSTVTGAASPYRVVLDQSKRFFRLRL
jgi:hypothetical protein